MAKKPLSGKALLKFLELPGDVPETITCQGCGEPMRWLPINKIAGYWLHEGASIDVCAGKNPMHPGKPLIAQNMNFYNKIGEIWHASGGGVAKQGDSEDPT